MIVLLSSDFSGWTPSLRRLGLVTFHHFTISTDSVWFLYTTVTIAVYTRLIWVEFPMSRMDYCFITSKSFSLRLLLWLSKFRKPIQFNVFFWSALWSLCCPMKYFIRHLIVLCCSPIKSCPFGKWKHGIACSCLFGPALNKPHNSMKIAERVNFSWVAAQIMWCCSSMKVFLKYGILDCNFAESLQVCGCNESYLY